MNHNDQPSLFGAEPNFAQENVIPQPPKTDKPKEKAISIKKGKEPIQATEAPIVKHTETQVVKKPVEQAKILRNLSTSELEASKNFTDIEGTVAETVDKCKVITMITTDNLNTLARELGVEAAKLVKEVDKKRLALNKPLQDSIKINNTVGDKLTAPLELQVNRLKGLITAFELEKERQRQAELKRIEDERKKKEEEQRLAAERVQNIKNKIESVRNNCYQAIDKCITVAQLKNAKINIEAWKPSEFYAEFTSEADEMKKNVLVNLDQRIVIAEEREKLEAEKQALAGRERLEAEKKIKEKEQQIQQEKLKVQQETVQQKESSNAEELEAQVNLMTFFSKIGIKKPTEAVATYTKMYGSAKLAYENKQNIINQIQETAETKETVADLKGSAMKNQRVDLDFEVLDINLVPREFLKIDDKKVDEAIKLNRKQLLVSLDAFKIEGIKITSKISAILKST